MQWSMLTYTIAPHDQSIIRKIWHNTTKQLLPCHISDQCTDVHFACKGLTIPIAPSSLFYVLCLDVNSACHCHFSHCEGLLLTLTRVFSVSAVHLKSLFLTDVTGQLVLLNKNPITMDTCFSFLLVWIFTFRLPGFPSAFSFFFLSVCFSSWAGFQGASVLCLPLFFWNWKLFFQCRSASHL